MVGEKLSKETEELLWVGGRMKMEREWSFRRRKGVHWRRRWSVVSNG